MKMTSMKTAAVLALLISAPPALAQNMFPPQGGVFPTSGSVGGGGGGGGANAFVQNGNSFGASAVLGTNDPQSLSFETNNVTYLTIASGGGFTLPVDTDWTLTGGVNGLSFDGTTFSVDATNNRIGIGTAAPSDALDVQGTIDTIARVKTTAVLTDAALEIDRNSQGNARSIIRLLTGGTVDWYIGEFNYGNADSKGSDLQFSSTGQSSGFPQFTMTKTGRFGVATVTPAALVDISPASSAIDSLNITSGALTSTMASIRVTGTFPASAATQIGHRETYTTVAGQSGTSAGIFNILAAGYTGNTANTYPQANINQVAGTGTWNPINGPETAGTDNSNSGTLSESTSSTAGTNIGAFNLAELGAISIGSINGVFDANGSGSTIFRQDSLDIGSFGFVTATKHASSTTEKHIGVIGYALGGDTNVAGYFGLQKTVPTFVSAALVANTGTQAVPMFIAQDGGVAQFTLADTAAGTGGMTIHNVLPSSITTGSCTAESLRANSSEARGEVTATCTAQTWIVVFTTTYTQAPFCTVTPMNAAATAGAATFAYTTSTTALTATVTTATTTGIWAYVCLE